MPKQFQRTHSVLFICCIELWTKAVLSSDPAFLRNIVVLRDPTLNPVTGQMGRIAGNESHKNRWKRIIKSLGYSKNIWYAFAAHIKPQLIFFPLGKTNYGGIAAILNLAMSRGRATINQTFFAGEIYLLFLCFKRFEFEYDTNKCGRIYIYIFFKNGEKSPL